MIEKNIDNFNYQKLSPFKWFVLNNFPFLDVDFDAMTEWQLFQKLGLYINKVIDSQNVIGKEMEKVINSYNELYNYVDNFFNNLDVQEEVNNKLNEMAEDGSLAQIINEEIFSELNNAVKNSVKYSDNKYPELSSRRIARWFQESGRNKDDNNPAQEYYGYLQGNCILDDGNGVFVYSCFDNEHKYISNKCLVRVISLSTGSVIREKIVDCGHGNSVAYNKNNNNLYIAECFRYTNDNPEDDTSEPSNRIFILNYENLDIINTVNIQGFPSNTRLNSFSFDEKTNKYYACSSTTVYEVNIENWTITKNIVLEVVENKPSHQSTKVYNDKIYYLTFNNPNLLVFGLDGKLENIYRLPQWIERAFWIGEPEDLTIKENGDIYIGSCKWACYNSGYTVSQVLKINPIIGVIERDLFGDNNPSNQFTVYIDKNFRTDPTGYKGAPFNEIFELSEFILSPTARTKDAVLTNIAPGTYAFTHFSGGAPCEITGQSNETVILNGIAARFSNLYINNVAVTSDNKVYTTPFNFERSNIYLTSVNYLKSEKYNTFCKTNDHVIVNKAGTYPTPDDDYSFIELGTGCHYNDINNDIRTQITFSTSTFFLQPNIYPITEKIEMSTKGVIPLSNFINKHNINLLDLMSKFNCIIAEFTDGSGGYHRQKFNLPSALDTTAISINSTNIANSEDIAYFNEMNISINDDNKLEITLNQRCDNSGNKTENVQISLIRLYLSK